MWATPSRATRGEPAGEQSKHMADRRSGQNRPEDALTDAYRYGESIFNHAARDRHLHGGASRDLSASLIAGGDV